MKARETETPGVATPLAVSIADAARMLSVSHSTLKREIARGNLKACRVGRRIVIRVTEIDAYLDRSEKAEKCLTSVVRKS